MMMRTTANNFPRLAKGEVGEGGGSWLSPGGGGFFLSEKKSCNLLISCATISSGV